ncbi:ankyrin repeat domain-containing protein 27-like isoform X1 [Polistes fuscatus]|uniref:ankyrin repeat domain-containing protein 27-like isoform X1 n=1 Tax=Polistes fuscatus TaxID=30207 RepID=UPI001CA7F79E|nr:ankyrin repeat domain-containing protein 27-like isoform X1 [Polistes fuscatus]XP_043491145.1 ankyrin repeat domain-containing protein 27-like isoform X1 [Polistes fuscatus]
MEVNYDEDVSQNPFLEKLRNYYEPTLRLAAHEGWIVCVPRCGTFTKDNLYKEDVEEHILIPDYNMPKTSFRSLSNKNVKLLNRILTVNYETSDSYSLRLLFEETFYNDGSWKYQIWCIECPINCESLSSYNHLTIVKNLQDAINLLRSEINEKTYNALKLNLKEFQQMYSNIENTPLETLKDSVFQLYSNCIEMILQDKKFNDTSTTSTYLIQNIKIAVETYILHALRKILQKSISIYMADDDANLNKIIRNLTDLKFDDLGIHLDLYTNIHRGKLELSHIVRYKTVLEKLECLRRSIRYISQGVSSISSDDLLPILVYLVIKTSLSNWIAQITFIKYFRLSASSINEADELAYLTTSLEAAVEYIKSGALMEKNKISQISDSEQKLQTESEQRTSLDYLFTCITTGDLSEVENLLSSDLINLYNHIPLCHPLCSCESCEISLAKNRLLNRPIVSSRNEHGSTALHIASFHGKVNIVDYLLSHGADANLTDNDSLTPLHCAFMKGHQNIVLLLLHANANPILVDNYENTALHLASDRGHEGCVKALLYFAEHNNLYLNVNSPNIDGDTPLHRASKWGYLDIIETLLEHGADCKIKNKWGQTSFDVAQGERVKILLQRIVTNVAVPSIVKVHHSSTISQLSLKTENKLKSKYSSDMNITEQIKKLFSAISKGDIQLTNYYLGWSNQNEQTTETSDLCHPLCCCERCAPMHDYSEKKNKIPAAVFSSYNDNGKTVLHVASTVGSLEIIQLLLDAGADVNVKTKLEGHTPLHLACSANKIQAVKIILDCGVCNINAKDFNGDTPLHLAIRNVNIRIVELLIRSGANTNIRNLQNVTPRLLLEKQNSKEVRRILKCDSLEYPSHYLLDID